MNSLENLIKILSDNTGVNFFMYKYSTIERRVQKRLDYLNIGSIDNYLSYLKSSLQEASNNQDSQTNKKNNKLQGAFDTDIQNTFSEETDELFKNILIDVTDFFRDKKAFLSLKNNITSLLSTKKATDPIRCWVVGCATGEEAYSLAILLSELLKNDIYNREIKIFASDVSEDAIYAARRGIYPLSKLGNLTKRQLKDYFIEHEEGFEVKEYLKKMVIFSRHDITCDPPFLKMDLISCRNLLIYLNDEFQNEILSIFNYAMLEEGLLFLGQSENINEISGGFEPIDTRYKIFQCNKNVKTYNHFNNFKNFPKTPFKDVEKDESPAQKEISIHDAVEKTLAKSYEYPYVIINKKGDIIETNGELNPFLSINISGNNINIFEMARESLYQDLNYVITRCIKTGLPYHSYFLNINYQDTEFYFRIKVKPVNFKRNFNYFIVIFEYFNKNEFTVSFSNELSFEDNESERVKDLKQELLAAREQINTYRKELQNSFAEAQSLNEELQSTNEELKSSNEELETSNEELQSLNEELYNSNLQLKEANNALVEKEKELAEREEKFRLITENSQDLICLHDLQGHYIYVSPSIERLTGFKYEELIGKSPYEFFKKEDIEYIKDMHERLLNGDKTYLQYRFLKKDGNYIWLETTATPIYDEKGNLKSIQTSSRNIENRKKAEEALIESEKMLSDSQQVSKTGSWEYDLNKNILYFSRELFRIYGLSPVEGEPNFDYFKKIREPENANQKDSVIEQVIKQKTPLSYEYKLELSKREVKWIESHLRVELDENGEVVKLFGTDQDITERKYIEEKIKHDEERFRNLVEQSPYAFFIHQHRKIIYANPETVNLLKADSQEQLIGLDVFDIIHPEYLDIAKKRVNKTINEFKKLKKIEEKFLCLDGTEVEVEIAGIPFNYNGEPAIQVIAQDITDRKLYERRLQESYKRFNLVINGTNDGIWDWNLDSEFIYYSNRFKELLGYSDFDLNNHYNDFFYLIHPDDYPFFRQRLDQHFISGKSFFIELRLKTVNEDYMWFQMKGMTEFDENNKPLKMAGSITDINDRKLFEESLLKEKNFTQYLLSSLPGTFYMFDENGKFIRWNKNLEWFTGYTSKELNELSALDLVPEEEREDIKNAINQVYEYGEVTIESYHLTKAQQKIPFLFTGVYIEQDNKKYVMGVGIDISERVQIQKDLQESLVKYNLVVDGTDNGIWDWDIINNSIDFSWAWNKILGFTDKKLPNNFDSWFERVHPDDYDNLIHDLYSHIRGETEFLENEHRILHKFGTYIWVKNKGKCARDDKGNVIRMVGRIIDITDRKKAEDEIINQNKTLESQETELRKTLKELSERNFELDQLVYKTSHDLRAPLSSILGLINVIKIENSFGNALDYINKIENRVYKLDNFIKTMLDYSRVSRLEAKSEYVDFKDVIKNCISDLEFFYSNKNLKPLINIYSNNINFYSDLLRIRIIFSNIISNAFKYLDPSKDENYLKIDIYIHEQSCSIRFEDNGIGIESEYLERIFEMFFRATQASEGSGLGMYIVKQSVDYLGGNIHINSEPQKGTVINMTLPNFYNNVRE